jgi:hypothetical protein
MTMQPDGNAQPNQHSADDEIVGRYEREDIHGGKKTTNTTASPVSADVNTSKSAPGTNEHVDPHAPIYSSDPASDPVPAPGEHNTAQQRDPICDPSADPMISRTPDKVQQQKDQEKQNQDKDDMQKPRQYNPL